MNGNRRFVVLLACLGLILFYCQEADLPTTASPDTTLWRNIHDSVGYVGMETCRSCHEEIYETFIQTGMGRSLGTATPDRSAAQYGPHALVFDTTNNLYYYPYFRNEELIIREFRLNAAGDTLHQREERVAYIVGSGHHTNSHIIDRNGYVYQAPITFYTQKGRWDLAPGYEEGNERFGRFLTTECLTCHNNYPEHVAGSLNKYASMPEGITCERCHGPGEIHVREKLAGITADTARGPDYSIVNPRRLSRDQQMDLCQRCHLQGIALLEEGKTFYDFRPGMTLSEVFNVYLPRFTNSHEKFIMASQADRLRLSACYQQSEMSCITCHNPHQSVQELGDDYFNASCLSCHQSPEQTLCSLDEAQLAAAGSNCVHCHMPPSGSVDIPHINITDHYISRSNTTLNRLADEEGQQGQFLGLEILTKTQASSLDMARAYIALYDKYISESYILDSAGYHLARIKANSPLAFQTRIHYLFARGNYSQIVAFASQQTPADIQDGWTAYRIGEAYYQLGQPQAALDWFDRTLSLQPYHLEVMEKKGATLIDLQRLPEAIQLLQQVLSEDPKRPVAMLNLGYIAALQGNFARANSFYDQAIALDPDYEQALLNKAAILLAQRQLPEARRYLERVIRINPQNQQAVQILAQF